MPGGSRFVGRTEELRILERAIDEARNATRVVFLTGEAGIGKTALAFEAAKSAQVATGRAWEAPGAPAFWLWSECLRELGEELPLLTPSVSDESRFAALTTIVACVRRAARTSPRVLILDDLQWADVPSLEALKLLVRTARADRLCIIATVREPNDATAALADVRREALVLRVGGLEREAIAELALAHGVDEARAVDAITTATGGNALFALELLGDPAARTLLTAGEAIVPRGVRELLSRHLARLDPRHREVIAWAAVGGSAIDVATIAAASSLSVTEAVDAACREHVLSRVAGTLRFAHDLLRSAAYAEIPHANRAQMHEAFARVLDGVDRVTHLFAMSPDGGDETTARIALDVAACALRRFAYEDAERLVTRAAAIFERSGHPAEHALALALAAEALLLSGDVEGSAREADRALAIARESGDAIAFARAALAVGLRRVVAMPSRPLAAALDEAIAKLDARQSEDVALRCALEARLASALQPALDPMRALTTARRAIERARRAADPELLARTIHAARPAFRMLEPLEERAGMDRELLALSERLGDRPLAAHAHARVFWTALEAGNGLEADLALRSLEEIATRLGMPNHLFAASLARCVWETVLGRFEEAKRALAELETTRAPSSATWPIDPLSIVRTTLFAVGAVPMPEPEAFNGAPPVLHALMNAFVLARSGRVAEAAAALPALAGSLLEGDQVGFNIFILIGDIASRIGPNPYTERCYELCLPFEGRHVVLAPLPGYDGAVDRLLGALANVRGDRAASLRHYDRAIALEERLGATPFAARSRAERARIATDPVPSSSSEPVRPRFVREGETWLATFGDENTRLKDADGLRYLAYLVTRPNVPVPVVELFGMRREPIAPLSGSDALDREAIASYRERARDLRESLTDAEARNDRGAIELARTELAFIEEELARGVGLGGRARRVGSDQEKIRINVTIRIRKTIDKLRADAPRLAKHLDRSVKTGNLCSYED